MPKPLSQEKKLDWQEKIQKQQESGLSVQRWCHENQISKHNFCYWRDKLSPKLLNQPSFTELKDLEKTGITIEYAGFYIHLDKNFESSTLKACLDILKDVKC